MVFDVECDPGCNLKESAVFAGTARACLHHLPERFDPGHALFPRALGLDPDSNGNGACRGMSRLALGEICQSPCIGYH